MGETLMIHLSLDNYLELCERAVKAGLKPGESMERVLAEMIKEGKVTRVIKTKRSKDDIKTDLKKHWQVLDLEGTNETDKRED